MFRGRYDTEQFHLEGTLQMSILVNIEGLAGEKERKTARWEGSYRQACRCARVIAGDWY